MNPVLKMVLGAVVGAAFGLAVYKFIGCKTLACPLSANPYIAMILWGLLGLMLARYLST